MLTNSPGGMLAMRLKKEETEMMTKNPYGCYLSPVPDSNYMKWEGYITGPKDTPYEGGNFKIELKIHE